MIGLRSMNPIFQSYMISIHMFLFKDFSEALKQVLIFAKYYQAIQAILKVKMGQSISNFCSWMSPTPDQPLSFMLHSTLPLMDINPIDLNRINTAIFTTTNSAFQYESYSIQYQCGNGQIANRELARLIVKPIMPGRGLIVYEWGYYIGMIQNSKPNDPAGQFVLANRMREQGEQIVVQVAIRGWWKDGDLVESCRGCNAANQELFNLQWIRPGRDLTLQFPSGPIKRYQGYIDNTAAGDFQNCLNGRAKIWFRDNSRYTGNVRNGQMSTQQNDIGLFISWDGREKYLGGFRDGQRHGYSMIIMKTEDNGPECAFSMSWEDGVPNVDTYLRMNKDVILRKMPQFQDKI